MLDLAGHVEGFGTFIFLALVFQLSYRCVIVSLELVRMACVKPMWGVTCRGEVEFKGEAGLYSCACAEQGFLVTVAASMLAVLVDFLHQHFRQNKFPARESSERQRALLNQV